VALVGAVASWGLRAEHQAAVPGASLQVVCTPDRPIAYPGASVTVRAWVTDASGRALDEDVSFAWTAATGTVRGRDVATWAISGSGNSEFGKDITATLVARHPAHGAATCDARVHLLESDPALTRLAQPNRQSGRAFLLPVTSEPEGYGLYSYLIFAERPRDDNERERYLKAIESYLLVIDSIAALETTVPRRQLNITMLPIRRQVALPEDLSDARAVAQTAQEVLSVYHYERAKTLLGADAAGGGPYLLSRVSGDGAAERPLFIDMSHVVPRLVWDWVKAFCALASQERSWSGVTITKLGLNLRNVVAVAARDMTDVVGALNYWIQVLPNR
jgi:hypothetical protein